MALQLKSSIGEGGDSFIALGGKRQDF